MNVKFTRDSDSSEIYYDLGEFLQFINKLLIICLRSVYSWQKNSLSTFFTVIPSFFSLSSLPERLPSKGKKVSFNIIFQLELLAFKIILCLFRDYSVALCQQFTLNSSSIKHLRHYTLLRRKKDVMEKNVASVCLNK